MIKPLLKPIENNTSLKKAYVGGGFVLKGAYSPYPDGSGYSLDGFELYSYGVLVGTYPLMIGEWRGLTYEEQLDILAYKLNQELSESEV